MIHLDNVSLIRQSQPILKQINWTVRPGEHWAILGLNGAGKTALLNIVNGYLYPSSGTVHVLGKEFGTYPLAEIRKQIGWVSSSLQERLHREDLVEDVVMSGKFASIGIYDKTTDADLSKAISLIKQLGCEHLLQRVYRNLSQGEKQRILIARAMMASPKILILDEPCTGLDFISREQLLTAIQDITLGDNPPTVIYVTHHIEEILPMFKNTLLLRKGEVIKATKTEHILTTDCLSDFFGLPVKVEHFRGRAYMHLGETAR